MKPLVKQEKSSSSNSEELASQRPKRSTSQKNTDVSNGLLWREETDLKKALYASLQETRKKNFDEDDDDELEEAEIKEPVNGETDSPKKAKVHAQRKFAQGSTPTSPVPTPQKVPIHNNTSTTELIPYRRPKTEDFLTFLCLRGTSILPPSLDFLNCCSKSDSSSDCHSLSPEPDVKECTTTLMKASDFREKINSKHDNAPNGLSKKHACKASSKRYPNGPLPVKKSNAKLQKEVSAVKKRKSRDDWDIEFLPLNTTSSSRTRACTLLALKEKYKKQRLAAGKKKLLPNKSANTASSEKKNSQIKQPSVEMRSKKNAPNKMATRNQSKFQEVIANKLKSTNQEKKLAIEKRKSLRSAHVPKSLRHKKSSALNKKTMWLRRAKLVPPIVDVDSDSEPEIINMNSEKKPTVQKVTLSHETSLTEKSNKKLRNMSSTTKIKPALTSRQILLRKHMQNRLKAKKSILHSKNLKSKAISKKSAAKQDILRKAKKSIGLKTMSLRKDLQNKRVTRSAKQQIEEMLWANPEKRTKLVKNTKPLINQKSTKKHSILDEPPAKKPKLDISNQGKVNKPVKNCDNLLKNKQVSVTDSKINSVRKTEVNDSIRNIKRIKNSTNEEAKSLTSNQVNNVSSQSKNSILKTKSENKTKQGVSKSKLENSKTKLKSEPRKSDHRSKNEANKITESSSITSSKSDKTSEGKTTNNIKSKYDHQKICSKQSKPSSSKSIDGKTNSVNNIDTTKKDLPKNKTALSKSEHQVVNAVIKDKKLSVDKDSEMTCSNISQIKMNSLNFTQSHVDKDEFKVKNEINITMRERKASNEEISKENISLNSYVNQISRSSEFSPDHKELNVQNNLNFDKVTKSNDKDISKLMTLNVECEEKLNPLISAPSTSATLKKETNLGKKTNGNMFTKPSSSLFKKHDDKKDFKKSHDQDSIKPRRKSIEKKQSNESLDNSLINIKNSYVSNTSDLISKSMKRTVDTNMVCTKVNTMSDSDSYSSSEELENIYKGKKSISELGCSKKIQRDSSNESMLSNEKQNETKIMKGPNISNNVTTDLVPKPFPIQNQDKILELKESNVIKKTKRLLNNSNTMNIESDDDSDSDLTIDQYIKLTNAIASSSKYSTCNISSTKKEINQGSSSLSNDNKNIKHTKKETEKNQFKSLKDNDKESLKSKKDGLNSKHKKDKDSKSKSHDKSKKEEKSSKKDSEKSLAKLLKKEKEKERIKSIKKEEKSKHKRDGSSSSKSSKRDTDKDGSKLKKEYEKDHSSLEKTHDKKVEFTEIKKEKSNKKESSKISRSNSYDETKSPKKKKKYNELKDIEKIKNLISNSCILNEISGFKAFKRRLSGEKSELKKRLSKKKQKKLALLKEKKLSKKISSKLLRKYSKKKGLKSKKNKLKKKGLKKESKMSSPKLHSKNKKQKHKLKDHHKKDNLEKVKSLELASAIVNKVNSSWVSNSQTNFSKSNTEKPFQNACINVVPNPSSTEAQTTTSDVGITANFLIDNVSEVIPVADSAVVSTSISQAVPADIVFRPGEEVPTIIATEYCGVIEEGFPAGTILLARDVSQVPAHFIPDTLLPKTMADAATNTSEEDIDEVISSIPEHMRSEEMSVGTQTITPAGSPSPTLETRSILPSLPVNSPLASSSKNVNLTNPETSSKTVVKLEPTNLSDSSKIVTVVESNELSTQLASITTTNSLSLNKSDSIVSLKPTITEKISLPKNKDVSLTNSHKVIIKDESHTAISTPSCVTLSVPKKTESCVKTEQPGPSKIKKRTSIKKHKLQNSFSFSKSESFPLDVAKMVSAPVYYPTSEEFQEPLEYIAKIYSEAVQFGICKIVPPPSFKPECKVSDDLRFMALNQYLHKMLYRWGPNVQHTACIKKHLKSQKVKLEQAPLIGGIELDISKFYHTVQQFGGLQQVIEKNKWHKVADVMRVPKAAQDRVTKLYDAYCKYLVSYDTLPAEEKKKLEDEVIAEHNKYVMLRNNKDIDKYEDLEEEENIECVTKGRSMPLSNFFRIARNTMSMWFKNDHPLPEEVEHEFWKIVTERNQHIVVHAGNIDSSTSQSGFPCNKSPFAKHPWNLKVLTNNSRSILRCMGPVSGITSPTLHVGMLFTTSCWYKDPHSLPWIEYLHTGASKIWYGIPVNAAEKFKSAMKKIVPEYCIDKPLWLSSESSMIPPDLLVEHGSSLSKTIQKSGQFVIIFPESFTSTICCGYCVSESVYFAPTSWLDLAEKAFQDINESCESPAFSLERLLFSIANDAKPQLEALEKLLPMIEKIRSREINLRTQLNEAGLKDSERLLLSDFQDKKKKSRVLIDESELECEVCSAPCYLSRVVYPQEDTVYCLPHALEHIQKKNLKLCKLIYTYDEKDFNDVITRVNDLVSTLPKTAVKKKSSKKKMLPLP